jgi:hypothetical protein
LVLELDRETPEPPIKGSPTGLVEALADLLLEALGVESPTMTGGRDEQQDHA